MLRGPGPAPRIKTRHGCPQRCGNVFRTRQKCVIAPETIVAPPIEPRMTILDLPPRLSADQETCETLARYIAFHRPSGYLVANAASRQDASVSSRNLVLFSEPLSAREVPITLYTHRLGASLL
jgi:hypothetical protein